MSNLNIIQSGFLSRFSFSKNLYLCIYIFLSLAFLYYHSVIPYEIITWAKHDDGWFIGRANDILSGIWFGPYTQMTLIKGPVYPIFLAFVAHTNLSLQFWIALLHLSAALLLLYALSFRIKSSLYRVLIFIFTLIVQYPIQHLLRDELSLVLFISTNALLILVFLEKKNFIFLTLLGIISGFFILTREDGFVTLLPMLFAAIFFSYLQNRKNINLLVIKTIALAIIIWGINFSYKTINYYHYGSFVGVELLETSYNEALNSIFRVREKPATRYTDIERENLDAIYRVSPTFEKLQPYLTNSGWLSQVCIMNKARCEQKDFGYGFFIWALRDVMAEAGNYVSPRIAINNYKQIKIEINQACELKKIKCKNYYLSKFPGVELFNFKEFFNIFIGTIFHSFELNKYGNLNYSEITSDNDVPDIFNIEHRSIKKDYLNAYNLRGWFYSPKKSEEWFHYEVVERSSKKLNETNSSRHIYSPPQRLESPDIALAFKDSKALKQRFNFIIPCNSEFCDLYVNEKYYGSLNSINNVSFEAKGIFHIDQIQDSKKNLENKIFIKRQNNSIDTFNNISNFYHLLSKYIFFIGIFSYLIIFLDFIYTKDNHKTYFYVNSFLWVSYFSKVSFISLIAFYFIPGAANPVYLYPAIVIMPLAAFFSFYFFITKAMFFLKRGKK